MPIIRAAAVDAVRPGLRIALSRARRPGIPAKRAAGHPTIRAITGTAIGTSIAAPMNRSSIPPSDDASVPATPRLPPFNIPSASRAIPPTKRIVPSTLATRAILPRCWVAPSRTASTGEIRVARAAGRRPAITVTMTPIRNPTASVCGEITSAVSGKLRSNAPSSARSPTASATPTATPTSEARIPIRSDSSTTARRTWERVAPIRRSVPSSRVRWATVIESVLMITKPPTKSTTPPKPRRIHVMMSTKRPIPGLVVGRALVGRLHLHGRGGERLKPLRERLGRDPVRRSDRDDVELAVLLEQALRDGNVEHDHRRSSERADLAEAADPDHLERGGGRQRRDLHGVSDLHPVPVGGARVEHDLAVARSPASLAQP